MVTHAEYEKLIQKRDAYEGIISNYKSTIGVMKSQIEKANIKIKELTAEKEHHKYVIESRKRNIFEIERDLVKINNTIKQYKGKYPY